MPSKKKKYNARFPAGRIKKIMQSDEEVGKVAQAVPIIISRTLELFVESLLTKTLKITNSRNAKTLSTSHMKQCIMSEQRFDFLRELVRNIPDISVAEEAANYNEEDNQSSPEEQYADSDTPYDLSMPSTSIRATSRHQQSPYQYHQHATNGQNGGNGGRGVSDYSRNYLKRSMSSNTNSVIMHTTSLSSAGSGYSNNTSDCLPAKLSRSESTPVPPPASVHPPRLKQQSYSMPSNCVPSNCSNKPNIPPTKPLRQHTAIPAPIDSIDYCSKPVVKIDYSNLPLTAAAAPLSAPAHIASMSGNNSTFNFTAEPVINIDLSNIVAASAASATNDSVATISIGTPPSLNSTQQSRNSKASMAINSPTTNTNSVQIVPPTITTMVNSNSCLELDEDYDNI